MVFKLDVKILAILLACRFKNEPLTGEQKDHIVELQMKISGLERKIKDFEISLPSQAG